jgi:hypothetical protein
MKLKAVDKTISNGILGCEMEHLQKKVIESTDT